MIKLSGHWQTFQTRYGFHSMNYPLKRYFFPLILIFLFWNPEDVFAQNIMELEQFNQTRLDYNQKGMLILGTWAVGNIVWGGIGAAQSSGQIKAFHQMNLYWNSVNLLIAGFGYWQASSASPTIGFWESLEAQHGVEKVLLVNAALDVAYIAGGLYLRERGLGRGKDQLIGFGKSIILQGAFLMAFDAVLYGFHVTHAKELPGLVKNISIGPAGFSMSIPLAAK